MKGILRAILKYKHLIIFLLLEVTSLKLNNLYRVYDNVFYKYTTEAFNLVNRDIVDLKNLFVVQKANVALLEENRLLRKKMLSQAPAVSDASFETSHEVVGARVINNSITYSRNFITIDKGAKDGVVLGMGVLCKDGIVGKVVMTSQNFSTIVSILNTSLWISAEIKNSNVLGSVRWFAGNPTRVKLMYVSRHLSPKIGDAVVASGYGDSFYAGVPIGQIVAISLRKGDSFYDIDVELAANMAAVKYVYVLVDNKLKEQISLEDTTRKIYG